MATRENAIVQQGARSRTITWSGLLLNDDGAPLRQHDGDRCVQVEGTFGGASVAMQGSNDGSNWRTMTDVFGNPATFTSGDLMQLSEAPLFIRPAVTGGDGTTDLVVILHSRS